MCTLLLFYCPTKWQWVCGKSYTFEYNIRTRPHQYTVYTVVHIVVCKAINECLRGNYDCHTAAICADSVGGFLCLCKPGNGTFCASKEAQVLFLEFGGALFPIVVTATDHANRFLKCIISPDVNECDREADCDTNAECTDTEGSYECHCNHGYSGDGFACTSVIFHN